MFTFVLPAELFHLREVDELFIVVMTHPFVVCVYYPVQKRQLTFHLQNLVHLLLILGNHNSSF